MRPIAKALLSLSCAAIALARADPPIRLEADLREAPRGLIHATLRIPAHPGPLTLCYARWIPGEHSPSGPVVNLAGLRLAAGGGDLAWRRDPENMFAIHLVVPDGAREVEARLDYLAPAKWAAGHTAGPTTTDQLAILNWNLVALYPAGLPADRIQVEPSLLLPPGWRFGTSLALASERPGQVRFRPVSLEMLVDQPVLAGAHFVRVELGAGGGPRHFLECAADSEAALFLSPERLKALRRMPPEYAALTGARFYESYHFLLALSDRTGFAGLEHHQCSDNRAAERTLTDDEAFVAFAPLLTHEYFHSWNGKHRRPEELLSADFQSPMRTGLLWVYEGLTEYYGRVMAARVGLRTAEEFEEDLAQLAARMTAQKGRDWRPLRDTADSAQLLFYAPVGWTARRRGVDYYDEGVLVWLEADALIRHRSHGTRSLDDFVRAFFGDGRAGPIDPSSLPGRPPAVSPYREADVYAALDRVQACDWRDFFARRLDRVGAPPPLAGLMVSGWQLVYSRAPNPFVVTGEKKDKNVDLRYTLGFTLAEDNQVVGDVLPGTAADRAGLGPGMRVIGVNGRKYSAGALRDALIATGQKEPIDLLVENGEFISTRRLDYAGGIRYPHLGRLDEAPDLLAAIIRPRAP